MKWIRGITVNVPRDRDGDYQTHILPHRKQCEERTVEDLSAMCPTGIATTTLSFLNRRLVGRLISPTEINKPDREFTESVENWRARDLSHELKRYLYLDGVIFIFLMRVSATVESVSVLLRVENWNGHVPSAVRPSLKGEPDFCLTFYSHSRKTVIYPRTQCHRASEQGVQTKDETCCDSCR